MNKTRAVPLLVLSLASIACGSTKTSSVVTGTPRKAVRIAPVKILMEGAEVLQGFEEIALVQATGIGINADLMHVVEGLKEEARKHGCDTVIHVRVDQGSSLASATGVCGHVAATPAP